MSDTKNCPYCGEEVLIAAKKCKHCGEWLNKISVDAGKKIVDAGKKIKEEIKMSKKLKTGIIVGATVVGGIVGAAGSSTPCPEELREAAARISTQALSIRMQVAHENKDPYVANKKLEALGRESVRLHAIQSGQLTTRRIATATATGAAIGAGLGTLAVLGLNAMKGQSKGQEQQTSGAPNPEREGNIYDAREDF